VDQRESLTQISFRELRDSEGDIKVRRTPA